MIILIGGASHTGKTLISQKLIEKYHFPCTSLDHLKMGFIRSGLTTLTVNDDSKMTDFIWPFVTEMIKTAIENNQNLILEGCYIPANWKESFSPEYLKNIHAFFIIMSQEYLTNKTKNLTDYANVIEKRLDSSINLQHLLKENARLKKECLSNKTPFIEITTTWDLNEILNKIQTIIH